MMEIERYKTEIADLFSQEKKLEYQLKVEYALAEANYQLGRIPKEAYETIAEKCSLDYVKLDRVNEIDSEIHHDLMAVVLAISEQCGEYGGYVHLGATSYDIQDTVRALQLKEAKEVILDSLKNTIKIVSELALSKKELICIGRTHGQHAVPTTYGMKFANFLNELILAKDALEQADVSYGKMSGAIGTYASYGTMEIEQIVLNKLQLKKQPVTTQVVTRVLYTKYLFALGLIATTLDHFARELRNLQRTEIAEIQEQFLGKQVGSSTMPQKRNPWRSERICGLARNIRTNTQIAFDNMCLEHERDLTNSSSERISLAESSILTHFIILEMNKILNSLSFDEENIKKNLYLKKGAQCAEHLMIKMTDHIGRQKAHELLKHLSSQLDFIAAVKTNDVVKGCFNDKEIEEILDPKNYVGLSFEVVENFVEAIKGEKND